MRHTINLSITGLGIIFYSPFAVAGIAEGEDYLTPSFTQPQDVARHLLRCDIAAFCTGSPGDFVLIVYEGTLDTPTFDAAAFKLRLGLEVRGGEVCFRDLYDLMSWSNACPNAQRVRLDDGFYQITVYSSPPSSVVLGDGQTIYLHFIRTACKPDLKWEGVPHLC